MRLRKKRLIAVTLLLTVSYIAWRIVMSSNYLIEDEEALLVLQPSHFAEDSRKGILYHHKYHKGIANFHIANDSWVRDLLKPYDYERISADSESGLVDWKVAHSWPRDRKLHPPYHADIVRVMQRMATSRLTKADVFTRGTQLKLLLTLEGEQSVVFKPKWYDNDFVLLGTPYVGKDRHYAEIAGFHLSRLLQFHRTPPVIGRRLHLAEEVLPVMTKRLFNTVYKKGERLCFYGHCYYCTGPSTGICADEDGYLDGALVLYLPKHIRLARHASPWRRTYLEGRKALWETQGRSYCERLMREQPRWNGSVRLLDLIDASVLDFLAGNADRHHYETMGNRPDSVVVLMDTGKGFGNPYVDETSILAPLTQCCIIRRSTWKRISELSNGPFSEALRRLLQRDPLNPILSDLNLDAIDRRLKYIVAAVHRCISRKGHENVLAVDKMTSG